MPMIPRDGALESGPALLREGYLFVSNRCRRLGSDAFRMRLSGRQAVCMLGREAAQIFYEQSLTRRGGIPKPIQTLLQDEGSVQSLDGNAHRHRKRLFLELASPDAAGRLAADVEAEWQETLPHWQTSGELVLLPALEQLLCRAACAWAGIPTGDAATTRARTAELAAMIDGSGSLGPRNWRGHLLRRRCERWAAALIEQIRSGSLEPPPQSPLDTLARHRDLDGRPLTAEVAAVELINLLRPIVAVARYAVFAALALHRQPQSREALAGGDEEELEAFVQEVRRFYPFFPAVAGRVLEPFHWRGERFPRGRLVLLDLYGTNHDPRIWDDPEAFQPERFRGWRGDPFTLIPQGGGDHLQGHRCPGEWATIESCKTLLRLLAKCGFRLPPQDLSIPLSRMPAHPTSGVLVELHGTTRTQSNRPKEVLQ